MSMVDTHVVERIPRIGWRLTRSSTSRWPQRVQVKPLHAGEADANRCGRSLSRPRDRGARVSLWRMAPSPKPSYPIPSKKHSYIY